MSKSNSNALILFVANNFKSKWLCLVGFLIISLSGTTQDPGYTWTFGSAPPFASTAVGGASGSHTLSLLGEGASAISVINEAVGLGTSCTGPINVGMYGEAPDFNSFGLKFNNSPQFINNAYTIELVVKFLPSNRYHRLLGFYDLASSPQADYGVYISPDNANPRINFYNGTNTAVGTTAQQISPNTWYHIVFVRDEEEQVLVYRDGENIGQFNDGGGHFLPHAGSSNAITFFKDDDNNPSTTEEVGGYIAKLSVYNTALTLTEVQQLLNNACNTTTPPQVEDYWTTTGNIGTSASNFLGTTDNKPLIVKTNNTEAFRVTTSGQVAIGVDASPDGYKLAIGGSAIVTKIRVRELGAWPDFVFDKKHKLPSLYEIEKYIQQHNRLPGIPSAAEVEEKGVDLGVNQAALLQKIEELTLYLIDINKQVEKLRQENEILRKQIEEASKKK